MQEMNQSLQTWSTLPLSILLLLSLTTFLVAQEVEDESGFNYIEGSSKGPENWGFLMEGWAKCRTGIRQSPINLSPRIVAEVPVSEEILEYYYPGEAILKNRGHDISLEWQGSSSRIMINGTSYILRQCHWHSPSEHTINGTRYALEIHLVHQSTDGKVAVIGILYKYGKPDPFLLQLRKKLEVLARTSRAKVNAGIVDPKNIRTVEGNTYYRYMGSLTTPPCDEPVRWTVIQKVASVSFKQVALLKQAVHDNFEENARPLQPLNGRNVDLYYQKSLNATPFTSASQHLPLV